MNCAVCGKGLTFNELGLNVKYHPGKERLCADCLAVRLNVPRARLDEKIEEFRRAGCKLFAGE